MLQVEDDKTEKLLASAVIPLDDEDKVKDLFSPTALSLDLADPNIELNDYKRWKATVTIIDLGRSFTSTAFDCTEYKEIFADFERSGYWPDACRSRINYINKPY